MKKSTFARIIERPFVKSGMRKHTVLTLLLFAVIFVMADARFPALLSEIGNVRGGRGESPDARAPRGEDPDTTFQLTMPDAKDL